MHEFLQFTVIGIAIGAVYAVAASGLVVTYSTTGVFNFAHGAVAMVSAFSFSEMTVTHGLPVWLALVVVIGVEAPILGVLVQLLMRRLFGASVERSLMVTLGLLLILLGAADEIWGGQSSRQPGQLYSGATSYSVLGVHLTVANLLVMIVAAGVAIFLGFFLKRTRTGVAMRAVVDDPDLLAMAGASPARIATMGWIIGVVLAAVAGILIAPLQGGNLSQTTLTLFVVNAYAAAVFGRLRNLPVTFVAALGVGLGETYIGNYLQQYEPGFTQNWLSVPSQTLPIVFLLIALLILPQDRLRAVGRAVTTRIPKVASLGQSLVGGAAVVALALLASVALGTDWQGIVRQGLIFGIVALSLVLLTGYAGQVSLCQVTFAGVGAFAMGKVTGGGSWLGVLAAVGLSAGVGMLVAWPTTRLRGLYLALFTLAVAAFADAWFFTNTNYLFDYNHSSSLLIKRLGLFGISFEGNRAEMILLAVAFALASILVLALRRGVFGRRLVGLSDSPAACATVGLNVKATKLAVFGISAGLAGLAGALYGTNQGFVGALDFQFLISLNVLLMLVIWGARSTSGALVAGLCSAVLLQKGGNLSGIILGVGVLVIGWLPNGIIGTGWPMLRELVRDRSPGEAPAPEAELVEDAGHAA